MPAVPEFKSVVGVLDYGHVIGGSGNVDVQALSDRTVKLVSSLDVSLYFKGKVFVWVVWSGHENKLGTE